MNVIPRSLVETEEFAESLQRIKPDPKAADEFV